jgi:hypothetical protein
MNIKGVKNGRYMDEQKSARVAGIWMNRKRVRVVGSWMNRKRVEAEKGGGGCMGRKNPNVKTGEWGSGFVPLHHELLFCDANKQSFRRRR